MIRVFALNAALQRRMMAAPYSRTVGLRPRLHYGSGNGDADRTVRLEGSRQNLRSQESCAAVCELDKGIYLVNCLTVYRNSSRVTKL
jgi:hypothetical protein